MYLNAFILVFSFNGKTMEICVGNLKTNYDGAWLIYFMWLSRRFVVMVSLFHLLYSGDETVLRDNFEDAEPILLDDKLASHTTKQTEFLEFILIHF